MRPGVTFPELPDHEPWRIMEAREYAHAPEEAARGRVLLQIHGNVITHWWLAYPRKVLAQ